MGTKKITYNNLKVDNSAELLSYIINQNPELSGNIDLPVQGESIKPIGKLIMGNVVYKNAFLNTINLIGLTVITRNHWENPWITFTDKGTLGFGQQVREVITDIANVYDYNEMLKNEYDFVKTEVPNVWSYMHEINYQKYYKVTTSDEQMAMAFETGDLFTLIDVIVNSMYEAYEYDMYQTSKYILDRRILDGTVTPSYIADIDTKSDRDIVAEIKSVSNDMTFRSPNFNPAGIRKATSFDDQFAIVSTKFDAKFSTNVLATSYFRDSAEMKAHMELCDGFGNLDNARLAEVFAKRDENGKIVEGEYVAGYVPISDEEKEKLNKIPCVIVGRDFFQNYRYGMDNAQDPNQLKSADFFNPQTLKRNHFLHVWGILDTSPYENSTVFSPVEPDVTSVTVNPSESTVSVAVGTVQLSAIVETTGFANKAVTWSVTKEDGIQDGHHVEVDINGKVTIPSDFQVTGEAPQIEITATSIFNPSISGKATISVV